MTRNSGQRFPELSKDHILVGKIIKSHGLKGEVKALPFSGCPENFNNYPGVVLVDPDSGVARSYTISRSRGQADFVILMLEGVTNRDDADLLAGRQLWIDKGNFPKLAPGEYYWFELEGMRVYTVDGRELGVVTSIFNNRAQDVLVVTGGEREFLIPVIEEIVRRRDDKKRILVVAPMPGLLDLDGRESSSPL
jgi:16S rRNA processing protein RimM